MRQAKNATLALQKCLQLPQLLLLPLSPFLFEAHCPLNMLSWAILIRANGPFAVALWAILFGTNGAFVAVFLSGAVAEHASS